MEIKDLFYKVDLGMYSQIFMGLVQGIIDIVCECVLTGNPIFNV